MLLWYSVVSDTWNKVHGRCSVFNNFHCSSFELGQHAMSISVIKLSHKLIRNRKKKKEKNNNIPKPHISVWKWGKTKPYINHLLWFMQTSRDTKMLWWWAQCKYRSKHSTATLAFTIQCLQYFLHIYSLKGRKLTASLSSFLRLYTKVFCLESLSQF